MDISVLVKFVILKMNIKMTEVWEAQCGICNRFFGWHHLHELVEDYDFSTDAEFASCLNNHDDCIVQRSEKVDMIEIFVQES
jgi:predicted glycosyltransferase